MIGTPTGLVSISAVAGQIGSIGSSTGLVLPVANNVNHLLGWKVGGLKHCQYGETAYAGEGRLMTLRHPNVLHMACEVILENITVGSATFAMTAGTGATTTINVGAAGRYVVAAPWDAADSGSVEVVYESVDCDIKGISIWEVPRQSLDLASGDVCIEHQNPNHIMSGLREGQSIISHDADYDVPGLALNVQRSRDWTTRQAMSWFLVGPRYVTMNAAAWTNVSAAGHTRCARGRQFRPAPDLRPHEVWVWAYIANYVGGTYDLRVTASSGDSIQRLGLNNVAPQWWMLNSGDSLLDIDADSDDQLTFECFVNGGGEVAYVGGLSIFEPEA